MFKKLPENRLTTESLTLLKFSKRIRPTRLVEKDHMYCVITYKCIAKLKSSQIF